MDMENKNPLKEELEDVTGGGIIKGRVRQLVAKNMHYVCCSQSCFWPITMLAPRSFLKNSVSGPTNPL